MWIIFKVFIKFVTTLLLCFDFLATRHVGSYFPMQGLNLPNGPPGRFQGKGPLDQDSLNSPGSLECWLDRSALSLSWGEREESKWHQGWAGLVSILEAGRSQMPRRIKEPFSLRNEPNGWTSFFWTLCWFTLFSYF